ncbi:isoleucine--tRNA ligase [Candidatus Woesearchaeota archaeon]|nr:isoleucine--tRNA ligase [Candidatus Woesearchaeota archaeon]
MLDWKKLEEEARQRWRKQELLALVEKKNKGKKKYYLLDGPPYANNIPHVGHLRTTMGKDVMIRLKQMQGYDVFFRPGFDTHGLPVENIVEKELKLHSKKDINELGVENFTKRCKELAATNKDSWLSIYDKMGSWYSWKDPYLTYDNEYIESGWWTFATMWKKGLAYEGKRPVFWCPHCETALAGYEVTDSYKMVQDPAVYVKFPVKGQANTFLLVYTTTPWTLVSNVAIALHPEEPYVLAETAQGNLILAKPRLSVLADLGVGYKIRDEFPGKKLEGTAYEPVLDVPAQKELAHNPKAHKVILSVPILKTRVASKTVLKKTVEEKEDFSHFVTMDEGTGLVHTAPGHGKTDNEIGQYYGLPAVSPLTDECRYTDDAGEFSGMFVKEADKDIIARMKQTGKLLHVGKIEHKYPLCWRCKYPLIFRMSIQWFLKIEPIKEKMLTANESVEWLPDFARERFHNWVVEADDWNVSRQRYWGIPLPIWECKDCGEKKVIGSVKELKQHSTDIPDDLHAVNKVKLQCKCGHSMTRVNDILDVWFDSGIAPWASLGYPYKNKALFEKQYPVDRINESQDQIRGWFYSLMFCGIGAHDAVPYRSISMPGWVVDEKGEKMSKSLGNVVYAKDALDELGGDIVRLYLFSDVAPYALMKFSKEIARKEIGKILTILWNLHVLAQSPVEVPKELKEVEDKWLQSRTNTIITTYTENIERFEFHTAGRALASFLVEDVSRWYVQLVRERMDKGDEVPYALIRKAVLTACLLLAPVAPHITDEIYVRLLGSSVHLAAWPKAGKREETIEQEMTQINDVVVPILALREKIALGLRWPLKEVVIETPHGTTMQKYAELIKAQTNCKAITVTQSFAKAGKTVKIEGKKISDDFGKSAPEILKAVYGLEKKELTDAVISNGKYVLSVGNKEFALQRDVHLVLEYDVATPYKAAGFAGGAVYVDTTRTPELDGEGYAREIMRRMQQLRKEMGLQKKDNIVCHVACDAALLTVVLPHRDAIQEKIGATALTLATEKPTEKYPQTVTEKIKGKEICFYAK